MAVPALAGCSMDIVVFKNRGVVHQTSDRSTQRLSRFGQQRLNLNFVQQIGLQCHRVPPKGLHLFYSFLRRLF